MSKSVTKKKKQVPIMARPYADSDYRAKLSPAEREYLENFNASYYSSGEVYNPLQKDISSAKAKLRSLGLDLDTDFESDQNEDLETKDESNEVLFSYRNAEGLLHCEEGPAIGYVNGLIEYRINGRLHNLTGPSRVWLKKDGTPSKGVKPQYWIENVRLTEKEFLLKTQQSQS